MQAPGSSEGSSLPPNILGARRQRQQRSVYSIEQREELETYFQNNQYPSYEERETLAARLHLQEHQVQVWFKNRRAKFRKMQEQTLQRGRGAGAWTRGGGFGARARARARALATSRARALAPAQATAQAPAAMGRGFPDNPVFASVPGFSGNTMALGGAVFQGDPGFYSPSPPNPFGGVAAAETSASSHMQAWWGPAQDDQNVAPFTAAAHATESTPATAAVQDAPAPPAAASAPAEVPGCPEDPQAFDFGPDLFESPSFADLLSCDDALEGPSSLLSGYPGGEESGGEDDSGPKVLQDL